MQEINSVVAGKRKVSDNNALKLSENFELIQVNLESKMRATYSQAQNLGSPVTGLTEHKVKRPSYS